MTWRPSPQPPCDCPSCWSEPPAAKRECTEQDPCSFCGPVKRFWSLDPSPVTEPPDPGHEKARPLKREPGGVSSQDTAAFGFTEFGQHTPAPSIIRHIRNATRRNT